MKQTALLFLVLLILVPRLTHAQNLIAVQNGNTPAFYTVLDSAIIHAQNGDTVYIPGGTFSLTVQFTKRLHIIGVGHSQDSTIATGRTIIAGDISLVNEASNGSLAGAYLTGGIYGYSISSFVVQRCRLGGIRLESSCANWSFIENIIQSYIVNSVDFVSNCYFYNNIIDAAFYSGSYGFTSSVFKNNLILTQYAGCGYQCVIHPIMANYSTFENNVFLSTTGTLQNVVNSSFYNNLFVETAPINSGNGNWGSDNILNQPQSTIFVNQTGNTFNYSHDYHLQPTSPGKNAGKDGTDIGIYGGAFPWKAGSVPVNPHVQYESVSGVGEDGNIHVVVKVAAQDR